MVFRGVGETVLARQCRGVLNVNSHRPRPPPSLPSASHAPIPTNRPPPLKRGDVKVLEYDYERGW